MERVPSKAGDALGAILPLWRNGDAASAKSLITVSRVVHAIIHIEMSGRRTISAMRVLVIDAGCTGLVLALWIDKLGVTLRIVDNDRDRITARLRGPDGQQEDLCGGYIAGCDRTRSIFRAILGTLNFRGMSLRAGTAGRIHGRRLSTLGAESLSRR